MEPSGSRVAQQTTTYVEVRRIVDKDMDAVSHFFAKVIETRMYKTFHPHPFDMQTVHFVCNHRGIDWYGGCFLPIESGECMVGYVILRGWDEGYATPSFGVCVLPAYQGLGLGKILLDIAILVARLRGSPSIRLKVLPDNRIAISMYERAGFKFTGDVEQGQIVGYLYLKAVGKPIDRL